MDTKRLESLQAATGVAPVLSFGMPVLVVEPAQVAAIARALRDQLGFDMLLDVTAVDWPDQQPRFEVVWHFWSSTALERLRLKTRVPGGAATAPTVASLTSLYGSAAFMERECHDMLGIVFAGNDDLRPILLYEGFTGHPLRKDYDKRHEQPLVRYRDDASSGDTRAT
jgi:NADH-quinone oxidoreductase subunit C